MNKFKKWPREIATSVRALALRAVSRVSPMAGARLWLASFSTSAPLSFSDLSTHARAIALAAAPAAIATTSGGVDVPSPRYWSQGLQPSFDMEVTRLLALLPRHEDEDEDDSAGQALAKLELISSRNESLLRAGPWRGIPLRKTSLQWLWAQSHCAPENLAELVAGQLASCYPSAAGAIICLSLFLRTPGRTGTAWDITRRVFGDEVAMDLASAMGPMWQVVAEKMGLCRELILVEAGSGRLSHHPEAVQMAQHREAGALLDSPLLQGAFDGTGVGIMATVKSKDGRKANSHAIEWVHSELAPAVAQLARLSLPEDGGKLV